ncbi:MAG: hypothetical protein JNM36_06480 [Chitinophagales bacterium]|nr:hypothetical protein [Chitinophagales bacterium]
MKNKLIVFVLLLLYMSCELPSSNKQQTDFYHKLLMAVLEEKDKGIEYFVEVKSPKITEYRLCYLGYIQSSKQNIDFIYSTYYYGNYQDAKHASCTVDLFFKNKKIGYYYIGGGFNALPQINGYDLIFDNDDEACGQKTFISFRDSIPNEIFIHCKKKDENTMSGDIFTFQKEE